MPNINQIKLKVLEEFYLVKLLNVGLGVPGSSLVWWSGLEFQVCGRLRQKANRFKAA